MAHIHFVTNELYKKKILRMGENKKLVFNFGSLAFSNFNRRKFKNKIELEKKYKIKFRKENFLVSIHPETIRGSRLNKNLKNIFKVFKKFKEYSFIFTASNNDHGGGEINKKIKSFVKGQKNHYFTHSFGQEDYFSMLKIVSGVIGNSSSGIIEVPSFKIGTINLGERQTGRVFPKSVINCSFQSREIQKKIIKITSKKFRSSLKKIINPYQRKNTLKNTKKALIKIQLKNILFKTFRLGS